jgi:hypothetical protein
MNDVIAPKGSSLIPRFVEVAMFLKLNMSLIPNNPANILKSLIWNTLIPSRPKLPNDIDYFDNYNENEEDDNDNDDDDEDDDLLPMLVKSEETNYTC